MTRPSAFQPAGVQWRADVAAILAWRIAKAALGKQSEELIGHRWIAQQVAVFGRFGHRKGHAGHCVRDSATNAAFLRPAHQVEVELDDLILIHCDRTKAAASVSSSNAWQDKVAGRKPHEIRPTSSRGARKTWPVVNVMSGELRCLGFQGGITLHHFKVHGPSQSQPLANEPPPDAARPWRFHLTAIA
ncbi:MAG: hypothetical protein ACKVY0_10900 [Prosthecobacter sp.]|uniref:hypothetical protein n=1 Tax=Prosthecobacter sp. TaxID=1965333 RepID=UPI0038FEDA44